jgi:hypothetical protein
VRSLGWLSPKEFLNTYEEWHAFVEGVNESFCFWRAHVEPSQELLDNIKNEHHYYTFGRVIGFLLLVGTGLLVVKAVAKIVRSG